MPWRRKMPAGRTPGNLQTTAKNGHLSSRLNMTTCRDVAEFGGIAADPPGATLVSPVEWLHVFTISPPPAAHLRRCRGRWTTSEK
jgi:hypothetical protein